MTASSDWTPATTRSLMDAAISAVAALASDGAIGAADEDALVDAAVAADPRVLILARHYGVGDPSKFAQHALRAVRSGPFVGYSSPPLWLCRRRVSSEWMLSWWAAASRVSPRRSPRSTAAAG